MDKIDDKILDKIKKCLALSKSSEPHEASAALRQAQKLMQMHNVSDIHIKFTDIGKQNVKSKFSVSRVKDYELNLIKMIAQAFGCRVIWTRSSSYSENVYGQYTLIGLSSQVQLCAYTCDVMQRKLVKAKNEFVRSLPEYYMRAHKVVESDGFAKGWVEAVRKTVVEFAQTTEVKALIDEYTNITFPSLSKLKPQNRKAGLSGYNNGVSVGVGESIQRPINEQSRLKIGAV